MTAILRVLAGLASFSLVACGGASSTRAANQISPAGTQPREADADAPGSTPARPGPVAPDPGTPPATSEDATAGQPAAVQGARALVVQVEVPSITDGDISSTKVHDYLRRSQDDFKSCYDKRLVANPTLAGRVTVEFKVSPFGRPSGVTAVGLDDQLDACVASAVRSTQLPKPYGGGYAAARVVIVFSTSSRAAIS